MGSCLSGSSTDTAPTVAHRYRDVEMTFRLKVIVDRWKLTNDELERLHSVFRRIDKDGSGTVEFEEFFGFLGTKRNLFTESMFSLIVGNDEQELDFASWLMVVFGFCLTTRQEMVEQVFYLFDRTKNGVLDLSEMHQFLNAIHGDNALFPKSVVDQLTKQNLRNHGRIDFDEFLEASITYPMLLWPIFRMQHRVRKRTLGIDFFNTIDMRISDTMFTDIHQQHLDMKFQERKECFQLYCCSFPCCMDNNDEELPTTISEIRQRKKDLKRLHQANSRRLRNPSGPAYEFKPLSKRSHHDEEDTFLEQDVLQVHTKPLTNKDLIADPLTLMAVDEAGDAYELSEGGSSSDSVTDVSEDEYPDFYPSSEDD